MFGSSFAPQSGAWDRDDTSTAELGSTGAAHLCCLWIERSRCLRLAKSSACNVSRDSRNYELRTRDSDCLRLMAADPIIYCLEKVTDYLQFERMCHDVMVLEGYGGIEPLGGFKDKGRDAIHVNLVNNSVTIFAYSVQEDWRKKLEEDAAKIQQHGHVCQRLVFVCTEYFTARERDDAVAWASDKHGWELELYGLERLRVALGIHPEVVRAHPQIFNPSVVGKTALEIGDASLQAEPAEGQSLTTRASPYRRQNWVPSYRVRLDEYAARCPELLEREDELSDLEAFAHSEEPYLWLLAPPWAGKTSLLTHFATKPPPGVEVVAFVISRRDGEIRLRQFYRAVCEQLSAIVGVYPHSQAGAADFLSLWQRAAAMARERGDSLVLVVDGLDENNNQSLGEPSIASQLPIIIPGSAHIVVSSRPSDVPPSDVDERHPLRTCRRRNLATSQRAVITLDRARHELKEFLVESDPRRVLGTLAAARGTMSARDLDQITGLDRLTIRRLLEKDIARSLTCHSVSGRSPNTARYSFAHELLVDAVDRDLEHDESVAILSSIHSWAESWAKRGWPEDTAEYMIEAYPNLLASERDALRLAALASAERHAFLRRRTAGVQAAMGELVDAARLLADSSDPDLVSLARVSFMRLVLEDSVGGIPPKYAVILARVGRMPEAVECARSMPDPYRRVEALLGVADALATSKPEEAMALAQEAVDTPNRLQRETVTSVVQAGLVLEKCGRIEVSGPVEERVAEFLSNLDSGDVEFALSDLIYPLSRLHPPYARRLLDDLIAQSLSLTDLYRHFAPAFIQLGYLDSILAYANEIDVDDRLRLLVYACRECFEYGGRDAIPLPLRDLLKCEVLEVSARADFEWDVFTLSAAKYLPKPSADPLLDLFMQFQPWTEAFAYHGGEALASHGYDPRNCAYSDGWDSFHLCLSASAARQCGHLDLATSLVLDARNPYPRAARLAEIALALLDSGHDNVDTILQQIMSAANQVQSDSRPCFLAKLAAVAGELGEQRIAASALDAAILSLPSSFDFGDHAAKEVAASAADLGQLEEVTLIATAPGTGSSETVFLAAAEALLGDRTRRNDAKWLIDRIIEEAREHTSKHAQTRLLSKVIELQVAAGLLDDAFTTLQLGDSVGKVSKLRLLIAAGHEGRIEVLVRSKVREASRAASRSKLFQVKRRDNAIKAVEEAGELIVELSDSGFESLARDLVSDLVQVADTDAVERDGLWPHTWLALACQVTGRSDVLNELTRTARRARLVIGKHDGSRTTPVAPIVRLGLWEQYLSQVREFSAVIRDSCLNDLAEAHLDSGALSDALLVIESIQGYPANLLARAANRAWDVDPILCRQLVVRSLVLEADPDVVRPLILVEPEALQEIGVQFGLS